MKIHARIWLLLSVVALAALTACGSSAAPGTGNPAPDGSSNAVSSSASLHLAATNMGHVLHQASLASRAPLPPSQESTAASSSR